MPTGSLSKNETEVEVPLPEAKVDVGLGVVRHLVLHPAELGKEPEARGEVDGAVPEHADVPTEARARVVGQIGAQNVEGEPDGDAEPKLKVGRAGRDREPHSKVEIGV